MIDLMKKGFEKKITSEELEEYKSLMTDEEKAIGKPVFEMNDEEYMRFNVVCYNNKVGELDGYNCPNCKNKGLTAFIKNNMIFYKPCKCQFIRKNYNRLEESGLRDLAERYTLSNYKINEDWQKFVFDNAKDYIKNNGNNFVIVGCSGSGKTHICTAIATNLIIKGYDLKYMVWVDEVIKLKQNKMNESEYNKIMKKLKKVPVLYIDDFLKSDADTKPSSADIMIAFEIINYRYNNKELKTIISSERTPEQLLDYDEAIYGRLKEMADKYFIVLRGNKKNYRLK